MPKMTVYVPDELQEAIDTLDMCAKDKVNWSSVAQEAFRREYNSWMARAKVAPKLRDAVDRLRRSKEMAENIAKDTGDTAGRKWAMERADYKQLVRLKQYAKRVAASKRPVEPGIGKVWPVFEAIVGWSGDDEQYDIDLCRDFWTAWTDEANDTFVDAFVNGALEVFNEVEPQL